MAQNDLLKRYVDAAVSFTTITQSRAEALVKDLVRAGEVQADQARDAVTDLLERSRKSSESLLETVRTEVRQQITNLGLASQADLDRIEQRISSLIDTVTGPAKKAAPSSKPAAKRPAPAKKAPAKKAPAKKAPAKKAASTAKKAAKKTTKKA
jgi:polyhydroxyalkanoate synthesis regulator phasin